MWEVRKRSKHIFCGESNGLSALPTDLLITQNTGILVTRKNDHIFFCFSQFLSAQSSSEWMNEKNHDRLTSIYGHLINATNFMNGKNPVCCFELESTDDLLVLLWCIEISLKGRLHDICDVMTSAWLSSAMMNRFFSIWSAFTANKNYSTFSIGCIAIYCDYNSHIVVSIEETHDEYQPFNVIYYSNARLSSVVNATSITC